MIYLRLSEHKTSDNSKKRLGLSKVGTYHWFWQLKTQNCASFVKLTKRSLIYIKWKIYVLVLKQLLNVYNVSIFLKATSLVPVTPVLLYFKYITFQC